jgi:hypothetical protein
MQGYCSLSLPLHNSTELISASDSLRVNMFTSSDADDIDSGVEDSVVVDSPIPTTWPLF